MKFRRIQKIQTIKCIHRVSLDRSVTPTYIMTISNRSHFDRQAFKLYIDKTFNLQLIAKTCMICARCMLIKVRYQLHHCDTKEKGRQGHGR